MKDHTSYHKFAWHLQDITGLLPCIAHTRCLSLSMFNSKSLFTIFFPLFSLWGLSHVFIQATILTTCEVPVLLPLRRWFRFSLRSRHWLTTEKFLTTQTRRNYKPALSVETLNFQKNSQSNGFQSNWASPCLISTWFRSGPLVNSREAD